MLSREPNLLWIGEPFRSQRRISPFRPHSISNMHQLRVLGFADGNAAVFAIDSSSPHSSVSESFLFRCGINPILNASGVNTRRLTLLVPTAGGYYTSHKFHLTCSFKCGDDVILGRDWLSECRPNLGHNTLGHPAGHVTEGLPGNQRWTADGMQMCRYPIVLLLMPCADAFLPFSLLHERAEQYRFSSEIGSGTSTARDNKGMPMHGHSEQALLDATCNRIFSTMSPFSGVDMTQHDDAPDAIYFRNAIFEFMRLCLSDEHWLFYSEAVAQHAVSPTVATSDGARTALLQHLFSGGCSSGQGTQCRGIVRGERWAQSVGIRVIDLTLEWFDNGNLTVAELDQICLALGLTSSATKKKRSVLSKLAGCRRDLVNALDMSETSIEKTMHDVASSSTSEGLRATCTAHNVPLSMTEGKEGLTNAFIEHVAFGKCAENLGPGCDQFAKEANLTTTDVLAAQAGILARMKETLTTRQLQRVMELHGIYYNPSDSRKRLKQRLGWYIQGIEKGKVGEHDAERLRVERLHKLEEVRKNWPKLVPPQLKERIVKDFRNATSSTTLATFTCACCARELPVKDHQRKTHTEVNMDVLSGPSVHWRDDETRPPPVPFADGPLAGKLLDRNGVSSNDGLTYELDLCTSCLRSLQRDSLPKHALANRLYLGPVPQELSDLTMVEESLIARARAKSWVVKLQETEAEAASPNAQRGLKGHTIIYPQEPGKLATILPPPIEETLTYICIIFVGSSTLTKEWLRTKAKPLLVRREKVYNALRWLKDNNPLYKDIEIGLSNLASLPESDVLQYHVEHVSADDAQQTLTTGYDNVTETRAVAQTETHFESVVVADVEAHAPAAQLTAAAVRHAKMKG